MNLPRKFLPWGLKDWLLAAYLLFLPIMDYAPCRIYGRVVLFSDFIFIGLVLVCIGGMISRSKPFSFDLLDCAGLGMIIMFSFSILFSKYRVQGAVELAALSYLYLLFVITRRVVTSIGKLKAMLTVWVAAALLVSLVGLAAFTHAYLSGPIRGNRFLFYMPIEAMAHHFPRIDSTFINANMLLSYLHVAICVVIILYLSSSRAKVCTRFFMIAIIMIFLITAFLTGSRRFTGLLLSLFLISLWCCSGRIARLARVFTIIGFIIFLSVSIVTTIWTIFPLSIAHDRFQQTLTIKAHTSYSLHMLPLSVALAMTARHPFLGVGLGAFNREFSSYVDWEWVKASFGLEAYPQCITAVNNHTLNFDPHSAYLGSIAETGIVGFLGLTLFLGCAMFLFVRTFKKYRFDGERAIISGCMLACLCGFIFNALTFDMLTLRHFWLLLALPLTALKSRDNNINY